MKKENKAP